MTASPSDLFKGLKLIDADSHYSEPYDLWTSRAPAKYRDLLPQVVPGDDGGEHWVLGGKHLQAGGGLSFVNRHGDKEPYTIADEDGGKAWDNIHAASYDPKLRVKLLDEVGIWAQVVYPNVMGFAAPILVQSLDRDLAYQCVAIYNDAVAEWAAESGGRLYPQAVLPFWDIEASVKESERIKGLGLTGVTMAGEPQLGGLPDLGQPEWEPLYEALTDLELPIDIHIGAANSTHAITQGHRTAWDSLGARAHKPVNSIQIELANSRFISNLVLSDVLLKYPKLKWVSVESGIGWIPYVLERVDYEYREDLPSMPPPDRPSAFEMFRRNIYACFWFENVGPTKLIDDLGVDNILWETDFPHPTCLYPNPVERSAEILKDLPAETIRKIMQDNSAKLYGIDLGE